MLPVSKPWYESKTIWLAIISGITSIVIAFATAYPTIGIFGSIVAVLTVITRLVTSLPISN